MIGYGIQAFATLQLYGVFTLWTIAGWLFVRRAPIAAFHGPSVFAAVAILAPIAMAQLLAGLFWVFPGINPTICAATLFALPTILIAVRTRNLLDWIRSTQAISQAAPRTTIVGGLVGTGLLCVILAPLLLQLFILPLHGNDPLEYMQLGRMFAENRNAGLYPLLTALPESGFVAPWTHPPTYGILISLAFLLQGSSMVAGAAKMIGPWFAVSLAALAAALVYAADQRISWRVWLAPAFVLSVPVFFELVQSAHIDGMRVAAFTAAVALGCNLIASGRPGAAILAGIGLAGAMLTHSIGILAPAIVLPLLIVCWTGSRAGLALAAVLMIGIALLIGAPHYVRNIAIFGNPIQDSVPIWDIASLKVKEFVRIARGLETLPDRLYLGALMPWTRSEFFGFLPTVLLLAAPIALFRSMRQEGNSLASAFAARGDSVATQLAVAILGFLALIFLSVLAGSELAVKNARYILTIVPLAVVVTLIASGIMIEDSRIVAMASLLGRAILRFLPRRLQPARMRSLELFDGPPAVAPKARRERLAVLADLAAVAVIGWLVMSQFQTSLRAAVGNMRIYIESSEILSRLTESEKMKRDGSILGDAQIERVALANVPADAKVLLFRQASYGFYASRKFVFHVDRAVEDLFREPDAPALYRALTSRGLKWILTPDFAMPEINNSVFSQLLRDSAFVRPEFTSQGWTLFALREQGQPADIRLLAQVRPATGVGGPIFGTTEQGSGFVDGRRAIVRLEQEQGYVELSRRRDTIKQLNRWDVLLSRPLRTGSNPHEMSVADWYFAGNDPVAVNAVLSGSGYAELVLEYTIHTPLIEPGGKPPSGRDDMDVHSTLVRETIWAGVLEEQPQTIGGWIVSPLSRLPDGTDRLQRGARMVFRLRDGDRLRVHEWSASQVEFPEQRARKDLVDATVAGGWSFSASNANVNRPIELRLRTNADGQRPASWPFHIIGVQRITTRPVSLVTPSFWAPDAAPAELDRERALLNSYVEASTLRLEIRGTIAGYGEITPRALVYCTGQSRPQEGSILALFGRGNKQEDASQRVVELPAIQLWGDGTRQLLWSESLPCVPYRVRLMLASVQQRLIVFEEFLKDPDRARSGFVEVHGLQVSLAGGGSASTRYVLPLHLRTRSAQ